MAQAKRLARVAALVLVVLSITVPTFASFASGPADEPGATPTPGPHQTDEPSGVPPGDTTPTLDDASPTAPGSASPTASIPADADPTPPPDPVATDTDIPSDSDPSPSSQPPSSETPTQADQASNVPVPAASGTTTPAETATLEAPTPTETSSISETPATTPTVSPTPTTGPAPLTEPAYGKGAVLINEIAWAGTAASPNDEWIELWNPGSEAIDLTGWVLTDRGNLTVVLTGSLAAHSFYLLERSDDQTIADIPADRIYTGSLNNNGETLELIDPSGRPIDTANSTGGPWPAGTASPRFSMERHGLLDLPGNWSTFPGVGGNGVDAAGNPVGGTPRRPNAPALSAPTATATPTPTEAAPFPLGAIVINEVAWAGTIASSSDEWIELHNPGDSAIPLEGWVLTDDGDLLVRLEGVLDPGGFYLLERSDDQTIADIPADRIYTGSLNNSGERLRLIDPSGSDVDTVNPAGGAWPAGSADTRASMERSRTGWLSFTGFFGRGRDARGGPIPGTPAGPNSILFPTPAPTSIPGRVVINEVLMRPRYDWEGAGGVTTADEFIEIFNRGPYPVNLRGWSLDDPVVGGSSPYALPAVTLDPGEFAVFFRSRTHIALNDGGDSVRLSAPDGSPVDKIRYLRVDAYNLSFGRLPDGDEALVYGLWPTPGKPNRLYLPPGPFAPGAIRISEVAWAGTVASPSHEWIELWNPGLDPINLFGWTLTDYGDIEVHLVGLVPPAGTFLLERSSDHTVADVPADLIYSGSLANRGEALTLLDPTGALIDTANIAGGDWPAGSVSPPTSMQRLDLRDLPRSWVDSPSDAWTGRDAEGHPIRGTPGTQPAPAPPPTGSICGPGGAPCMEAR